MQPDQPLAQLAAHVGVEGAERFVEQQDTWLDGERPSECHALPLPARQLRGKPVGERLEVDERQQFFHPLTDLGLRHLADLQPERDVAGDAQAPVRLMDRADVRKTLQDRLRRVGRAVIDNNNLEVRVVQLKQGAQALLQGAAAVRRNEQGRLCGPEQPGRFLERLGVGRRRRGGRYGRIGRERRF